MIQPFSHIVEQRIVNDHLFLSIQTKTTIDSVSDIDGIMVDNSVYRHLVVDLTSGDVLDNYPGPIGL